MALTTAGSRLTNAHAAVQEEIGLEIEAEVLGLWRDVFDPSLRTSGRVFAGLAAGVAEEAFRQSQGAAGAYLRAFTETEVDRALSGVSEAPWRPEWAERKFLTDGLDELERLIGNGWTLEGAVESAGSRVAGAAQNTALAGGRNMIVDTTYDSDVFTGWRRVVRHVGQDGPCSFCRMLADNGAVYSERSVRFAAHNRCYCVAEPAFDDGPSLSVHQYVASTRRRTARQREELREYLRAFYG